MSKPFEWKQDASFNWHAVDHDGSAVAVYRLPVYAHKLWSYAWAGLNGEIQAGAQAFQTDYEAKARVEYVCAPETEAA